MPDQLPDVQFYLGSVHPTEGLSTIRGQRYKELELAKQFQVFTLLRAAGNFDGHEIYTQKEIREVLQKLARSVDQRMANCFPNESLR